MTLDGSSANQKVGGRLLRRATLEYALINFPPLIVEIALDRLRRHSIVARSINGKEVITVSIPQKNFQLTILKEDFDICKDLAINNIATPLFVHDKSKDLLNRARGMVREAFSDRTVP